VVSAGEQDAVLNQLPWRGPGPGRPSLPLPPGPMPMRSHGAMRKRWRYVGVYGPELMLCAARVQIGPFSQCFWALFDRDGGRSFDHTRLRPGGHEVVLDGPEVEVNARGVRARLLLGDSAPVESICRSGAGWGWTRKRAGLTVRGRVEAGGRSWEVDAFGVDDESAGYHGRHTGWHWSAGVGSAADGRPVAWNLVSGINDPPQRSERAVWIGGVAAEPDPVEFAGLDAVRFAAGDSISFRGESERARDDNMLVFRSRYRHRFGTFAGSLDGVDLARGFGVMEEHEALW
jgi:hypothetical protein